jgi:oligoendopeptidase F
LEREHFGDSVDFPEHFRHEWELVAHFFKYPFYVYSYAMAALPGYPLYVQFREEGKSALPRWTRLLSRGNSMTPTDALAEAGIDLNDPRTFERALGLISDQVTDLETLVAAKGL